MKTILMTILVGLTMSACSGCDDAREEVRGFGVEADAFTIDTTGQTPGHYLFAGSAKFYPDSGFKGVVQELRINGELIVVEYWKIGKGYWGRDIQKGQRGELRTMTVYPADVEGCNLNENGYGMIWRTDSMVFNPDYAPPSGSIVKRSQKETAWSIDAQADGVLVTIGSEKHWFAK